MRDAFIEELTTLAETNERLVLVTGDLGYGVIEKFVSRFPKRFFNAGVAEQNMMGFCAGLASEGFHVFAYSIANFSTFRCAEQIRNDIDYHNLSVTVVAVGGGLAYGNLGYSHHAIQDLALMRSFPNMLLASPGDPLETVACLRYLADNPQPSYLRLGRGRDRNVHTSLPIVQPGIWVPVRKADTKTVRLSTGGALPYVSDLPGETNVYSMPLWGAAWKDLQAGQMAPWSGVETYENHLVDGGFGGWLMESLMARDHSLLANLRVNALPSSICGVVGTQDELMLRAGW
jgi:transketolase